MSAYDDIGGSAAISAAVAELYRRILADEELAGYFSGTDLGRLRAHQRAFLTQALGGPQHYSGRPLAEAHAGLHISDDVFDRVVDHLLETLRHHGLGDDGIAEVRGTIESLRGRIVTAGRARALH